MNTFLQDLRYGLRIHTKDLTFTGIAALTLALGIGASAAVFSVVNAILVKPLPYPNAWRVVTPWRLAPPGLNLGYNEIPWGVKTFQAMAQETKAFQTLGAFKSDSFNLTGAGEPVFVEGLRASAGFFATLGVAPMLGRTFTTAEDRPGREREVVLSHVLWQNRFGADPAILGRSVNLNGYAYSVIGIMPPGFAFPRAEEMPAVFDFPRQVQLWVPLAPGSPRSAQLDDLAVIGLLRPGITVAQAQAEMYAFSKRMESEFPDSKGWFNSRVTPLNRQVAGDTRGPLLLMLAAVGVVLLIACSNVANLLLARCAGRKMEFALRASLGAGRGCLIRQVLTESLALAAVGGLLGTLLAEAGMRLVKAFGPSDIPRLHEISLDWRVLGFLLSVTVFGGLFFGLALALGVVRENLAASLNEGGQRSASNVLASRVRNVLFVSQVALALVLVVASALLVQTFFRLVRVNPGFNAERVLTFELSLPASKYTDVHRIVPLYHRALERFQSIAGVQAAGIVQTVPMGGASDSTMIRVLNRAQREAKDIPFANYTIASPGYFSVVGTPLVRGRVFRESDTADSTPVTVINRAMATKFWPDQDPIGQQVGLGSPKFPPMTIVGIVGDVKHLSLRESPGPEMYVPYTQNPYPSMLTMHVVLRTNGDPRSLTGGAREAVRSLDPELPLAKVMTLTEVVTNSLAGARFAMLLLAAFGGLALILASVGMYGVISYGVSRRTREIGIRMALGAPRKQVIGMVLSQGARLTGLGIAAGLVCAVGANRVMSSVLYGVPATDLATLSGVSLLLIGVALMACYLPARRALRVEPTIALRC